MKILKVYDILGENNKLFPSFPKKVFSGENYYILLH